MLNASLSLSALGFASSILSLSAKTASTAAKIAKVGKKPINTAFKEPTVTPIFISALSIKPSCITPAEVCAATVVVIAAYAAIEPLMAKYVPPNIPRCLISVPIPLTTPTIVSLFSFNAFAKPVIAPLIVCVAPVASFISPTIRLISVLRSVNALPTVTGICAKSLSILLLTFSNALLKASAVNLPSLPNSRNLPTFTPKPSAIYRSNVGLASAIELNSSPLSAPLPMA